MVAHFDTFCPLLEIFQIILLIAKNFQKRKTKTKHTPKAPKERGMEKQRTKCSAYKINRKLQNIHQHFRTNGRQPSNKINFPSESPHNTKEVFEGSQSNLAAIYCKNDIHVCMYLCPYTYTQYTYSYIFICIHVSKIIVRNLFVVVCHVQLTSYP